MSKKYISLSRLSTFLDNLKGTFANISHKHNLSDISDYKVDTELSSASVNPVQNSTIKAALDAINDDALNKYKETIIGLSIDGQTVTYIKGDGSTHSFITQDTDTTYKLATDEETGLTKLYAVTGSAEDGTMTQKAITTELNKKVGVAINDTNHTLIFTI